MKLLPVRQLINQEQLDSEALGQLGPGFSITYSIRNELYTKHFLRRKNGNLYLRLDFDLQWLRMEVYYVNG